MTGDLRVWLQGRYFKPVWAVALIAAGVAMILLLWWTALYDNGAVADQRAVVVVSWEVAPAMVGAAWMVLASPRLPGWERLGDNRLNLLAGGACAVGFLAAAVVPLAAWAVLNHLPSSLVPFYHEVFIDDGQRLADATGASQLPPYAIVNGLMVTAMAAVAVSYLGRFGGVIATLVVEIAIVVIESAVRFDFIPLRAPAPNRLEPHHLIVAAVLACLAVYCWYRTKGRARQLAGQR